MQLSPTKFFRVARREEGFTLIFALIVLFVGGLLVAGAFAAVNGDVDVTRRDTNQKKAYYAALAGVEQYKSRLNNTEKYWFTCPKGENVKLTGTNDESYSFKTLPASGHTTCEAKNQLSVIEGPGRASGTFRIESTGTSGGAKRSIVATFAHPGFTNYVYFSNYEVEDPTTFEPEPTECEHYYKYRVEHGLTEECGPIQFAAKDKVNGPLHTNDAADLCAEGTTKPTFGRNEEDNIEMNGGHYSGGNGCSNSFNMLGTYTEKAQTLLPPATDGELLESAGYKFTGRTTIVLKAGLSGNRDTMIVTTPEGTLPSKTFPANGVVYVKNSASGCNVKYTPFGTDYVNDTGCGNVYVSGSYTEPLTIAAENDVIVNGSITTTATAGKPTGTGTLGLIATNFVRIYHPVKEGYTAKSHAPENPLQTPINKKCIKVVKTMNGKVTSGSTEITGLSSTTGLALGNEVTGAGIPPESTISTINSNKTSIKISNNATASSSSTSLTFYAPTGYEYYSGIDKCVEEAEGNFVYNETENLFIEKCESGSTSTSATFCKYENNYKRCSSKATNLTGSLNEPTIDAAILSTQHSFIVDNFKCGEGLGELTVWGSIAQFWRGPVGVSGGSHGYIKNYNYDDRLATAQPPEFLSSTTSWKLSRETAPPKSFG
jgi:type II secretory pathway pseudopilin PulG